MRYARDTDVPPEQSRLEIERLLTAYGATHFGYFSEPKKVSVVFQFGKLPVRLDMPLPDPQHKDVRYINGRARTPKQQASALDKLTRQSWRVLLLLIRAKLEAIEAHISSPEKEFLADIVLPNGTRIFDDIRPRLTHQPAAGERVVAAKLEGPKG